MKDLPPKLEDIYKRHRRNDSHPSLDELRRIFLIVAKHFNSVFLVLDALDECTLEQRAELCEFFSDIMKLSLTSSLTLDEAGNTNVGFGIVKLFVTSRKEPDIERAFRRRSIPKVEIEAQKVDSDIAIYVESQIEQRIKDERLILRDLTLKDKILTTLTTKANGMYVYPESQINTKTPINITLGFYGLNFS